MLPSNKDDAEQKPQKPTIAISCPYVVPIPHPCTLAIFSTRTRFPPLFQQSENLHQQTWSTSSFRKRHLGPSRLRMRPTTHSGSDRDNPSPWTRAPRCRISLPVWLFSSRQHLIERFPSCNLFSLSYPPSAQPPTARRSLTMSDWALEGVTPSDASEPPCTHEDCCVGFWRSSCHRPNLITST